MVKLTIKNGIIREYEGDVKELYIPDGAKIIKNDYPGIFEDHTELTSIFLPEGLTRIGDRAFAGCIGLKTVVIPETVTVIGESAFSNCSSLQSITIPDSVKDIGSGAFSGCTALTDVHLSNNMTYISPDAFEDCTGLKDITIPDSVESIAYGAFRGCTRLANISFPARLEVIGRYAFYECSGIKSIILPEKLKRIYDHAFDGCSGLLNIKLPDSLECIYDHAFENCTKLREIEIPKTIKSIRKDVFDKNSNLLINGEKFLIISGALVAYTGNDPDVAIPEGTMYIERDLFSDHEEIQSLAFPHGVTHIGKRAFKNCKGLTSLDIPDSVVIIESEAFAGCRNLTNVTIPESVIKIGTKFEEDKFSNPEDDIFFGCLKSKLKLHVHEDSSAMAYAERLGWKYKKIKKSEKPAVSDIGEKPNPKTIEFLIDIKSKLFNGDMPCDGFFDFKHQDLFVNFEAAGTMYEGRTENIEDVNVGDSLQIIRDPQNEYNSNNFRILTEQGKDVGNMPAFICDAMAPHFDRGRLFFNDVIASYVEPLSKRGKIAKKGVLYVDLHCGSEKKEKIAPVYGDHSQITISANPENKDDNTIPFTGSAAIAESAAIISPESENTLETAAADGIDTNEKTAQQNTGGRRDEKAISSVLMSSVLESIQERDTRNTEPEDHENIVDDAEDGSSKEQVPFEEKTIVIKRDISDPNLAAAIDRVLEKLEELYPERKVFALDNIDTGLRANITNFAAKAGYPSSDEMLRAYGYEFINGDEVKKIRSRVIYTPGNEPEIIRSKIESMLLRLEQYYPDHVIAGTLAREHKKLAGAVSGLYQWLGYPDPAVMLAAYGYTYNLPKMGSEQVNDYDELIRILVEKYKTGPKPKNMSALIRENPEYKAQLKTLQNNQYKILGMKAKEYFIKAGICDSNGSESSDVIPVSTDTGTDQDQISMKTDPVRNTEEDLPKMIQTVDQSDDHTGMDPETQTDFAEEPGDIVQTDELVGKPELSSVEEGNRKDSNAASSELSAERSDTQINVSTESEPVDHKAAWIHYQASEVVYSGRASAYFFFALRNEMTLGNYDWQSGEFLNFYLKYFPGMNEEKLAQLRMQAIPWLNDPNTCNAQYQIIMQDTFEHRYVMIASAWFARAVNYDPILHVQFIFNACRSFFYPQEQKTVWQRLCGEAGL